MSILSFLRDNARWIIGGMLMTFFSSFGQTIFISMSGGDIRHDYGLSNGQWGTIYMVATLASALTLPYVGALVDRYRAIVMLLVCVPMLAFGAVAMGVSTDVATLGFAVYLLRLFGQGMLTHSAYTATARWFSAQRGKALSLVIVGHNIGDALCANAFVLIAAAMGWRWGWHAAALSLLVGLPVMALLIRVDRTPSAADPPSRHVDAPDWTRAQVVRDPLFYLSMLGVVAPGLMMTSIIFHQSHLIELRGWSAEVFASAFIVWGVVNTIFTLLSGYLIDRYSGLSLFPFVLIPMGLAFTTIGIVPDEWAPFAFMAFAGIGNGLTTTLFGAVWPEIYGLRHLGSIRAVVVSASAVSGAVGPGLSGYLIDMGVFFPHQLVAMGGYCFIVCFAMGHVVRRVRARAALPIEIGSATPRR